MFEPVNWKMISHPINWVVILLMLIIAGAFGHYLLSLFGVEPATAESSYAHVSPGIANGQAATGAIGPQSVASKQ